MKGAGGSVLYVGKAANLKRRVSSYFQKAHDVRIERLVGEIRRIDFERTGTAIEALIREAELIKKLEPPYNVREKDDKSFLHIVITREKFPRVLVVRGKDIVSGTAFGPFTSASNLREAMRILRKIFPWNDHDAPRVKGQGSRSFRHDPRPLSHDARRPCFNYQIGLCPGTCVGAVDAREYRKTITQLKLFLGGGKKRLVSQLTRDMRAASRAMEYERAEGLKRRLLALQHIQDVALIADEVSSVRYQTSGEKSVRIEGYDISNISGTSAVGSMVVFVNGRPVKDDYRKFAIRTVEGQNDVAMLAEVLTRRLHHREWPVPDLILVDGGAPQVSVARKAIRSLRLAIPIVGIAKGPERKRNDVIGIVPPAVAMAMGGAQDDRKKILIHVRDEAHRFAVQYHRKLRDGSFV
jgi:excinuclease ABC subunit C